MRIVQLESQVRKLMKDQATVRKQSTRQDGSSKLSKKRPAAPDLQPNVQVIIVSAYKKQGDALRLVGDITLPYGTPVSAAVAQIANAFRVEVG